MEQLSALSQLFGGLNPMVIDAIVFFGFLFLVVFIGITMSRKGQDDGESYFLAGRGLGWWLIGFSLIAANISTEQFVGMSGQGADYIGLAVASYEWIAAVTLVLVGFFFLPRFLKAGIYTIPEFLEYRYNKAARTLMSLSMMMILIFVTCATVIYSGAKPYLEFFKDVHIVLDSNGQNLFTGNPLNLHTLCWIIGIIAASYVFLGGLKACAWADLLQGSALIICGGLILYFALGALGNANQETMTTAMQVMELDQTKIDETVPKLVDASAIERFQMMNQHKLRMNLPWTDSFLPIIALFFGIWIPNLYYWGLNQFIMQRTLGAQSLSQGQKGIVFAAFLKLLIPFIVIFPGIIAFNLYHKDMKEARQEGLFGREYVKEMRMYVSSDYVEEFPGQAIAHLNALKEAGLQASMEKNTEGNLLFDFDDKFAAFEPAVAAELIKYDAKLLEIEAPEMNVNDPESLVVAMKAIKKANDERGFLKPLKFSKQQTGYDFDAAFPLLITKLVPSGGLQGFALAALLGAIISSLAAMLNAASTMFTIDIYKGYIHKKAPEWVQVAIGRLCVIVFMVIACLTAPILADPRYGGVFKYIQEFQGYISPGILAAFLFGFVVKRPSKWSGAMALILNPAIYGLLMLLCTKIPESQKVLTIIFSSFLNRMAVTFVIVLIVMTVMTILWPNKDERTTDVTSKLDLRPSYLAMFLGVIVILITIALYVYFWDTTTPMFPLK
ncbi:MAG: sodium/solute symporter [Planctomycetaceae bacterium]|nr:sodium/solute symporter [Planctomycetaceae bacterium]